MSRELSIALTKTEESELARICRVSIKTARRWKRGQTVPPESALMLLRGDPVAA